jgi:hypothetical protein
MGWGDELIVTGEARRLYQTNGRKVVVQDKHGQHRFHELWHGNPYIATRSEKLYQVNYLRNCPGFRPYIKSKTETRWFWNEWQCVPGEIYLTQEEVAYAAQFSPGVVIEPNIKQKASPNKDWGRGRWVELINLLKSAGLSVSQLGSSGTQVLPGARLIHTPTFRMACAVLARATAAVLPEGGLHHAAAAVGLRRVVVIYGGFISPKQTGYYFHKNLFTGVEPCGLRVLCEHCSDAMAAITPGLVAEEILGLLP